MKLTIQTKTLAAALAKISKIPGEGSLPYTTTVKLEAGLAGLEMLRFTDTCKMKTTAEIEELEEDGEVSVNCVSLANIVQRMTADTITIQADETHLNFKSGSSKAKLSVVAKDQVAEPPKLEEPAIEIDVNIEELLERFAIVQPALGADKGRAFLTGVCIRRMHDRLAFIGADGRRAHVAYMDADCEPDCIIPGAAIASAVKGLSGTVGDVTLGIGSSTVFFNAEGIQMSFSLMAETYPQIGPFLAPDASSIKTKVTSDRDELRKILKSCDGYGEGDGGIIRVATAKGGIVVTAGNKGDTEMTFECDAKVSKAEVFGIGGSYLAAALEVLDKDKNGEVELEWHETSLVCKQVDRAIAIALARLK